MGQRWPNRQKYDSPVAASHGPMDLLLVGHHQATTELLFGLVWKTLESLCVYKMLIKHYFKLFVIKHLQNVIVCKIITNILHDILLKEIMCTCIVLYLMIR